MQNLHRWAKLIFGVGILAFCVLYPKDASQQQRSDSPTFAELVAYTEQVRVTEARTAPEIDHCFVGQEIVVRRLMQTLTPVEGKSVKDYPELAGQPVWYLNSRGRCQLGALRSTDKVVQESQYETIPAMGGVKSRRLVVVATNPNAYVIYSTPAYQPTGITRTAGHGPSFCYFA